MAGFAHDAAKRADRLAQAKGVHDELIGAAYRAQADVAMIEAAEKARLADECDAAQERGEVAGPDDGRRVAVPDGNALPATAEDIGLTRKQVHEARQIEEDLRPDQLMTENDG